mmetsp:Transcript_23881/g.61519  ORF Transcript_23881/g.61519 Transcript_23881/m.61519 type:complete len:187 (-) Transcript_23881:490-1050(-)
MVVNVQLIQEPQLEHDRPCQVGGGCYRRRCSRSMQRAFGLAEGAPCFFDHTAFGMRPVDVGVAFFHIVSVADARVIKQLLSKPVAYFERQIERRQRGASAGRINDLLHDSDDDDHDGHDGDYGDDDCMQIWCRRGCRRGHGGARGRGCASSVIASKLLDGTSLADLGKQNMLTGGGIGPKATHRLS